jgi:uncharacterized protein
MAGASPREAFETLVEGVAAGRLEALPALYAEETDVTHPFDPLGVPALQTRAELAAHFGGGGRRLDFGGRREVVGLVVHETADPEVVVGEFAYRWTGGETGAFTVPCVFVMRVRDGEIVESRDYIDPLAWARATGGLTDLLDAVRVHTAREAYERGMFYGERGRAAAALADLDGLATAEAELERGKLLHVAAIADGRLQPGEREAFGAALAGFRERGSAADEAEALFWLGLCDQWDGDDAAAEPLLRASYDLAAASGDRLTHSYAARHLGFVAAARGETDEARSLLQESLRLRQELGFDAGVAAAQLALAELEREQGRSEVADTLLDEADRLAEAIGAVAVSGWIAGARAQLPAAAPALPLLADLNA